MYTSPHSAVIVYAPMKFMIRAFSLLLAMHVLTCCETAEDAFIGDRISQICDEAYYICQVPAGCILEDDRYSEGVFPGIRRVVVKTEETDVNLSIRLYLRTMEAPGTELLLQAYEPDCTLDTNTAREHLQDVDLYEEAGNDRMLMFELKVFEEGEHLLEIYSDCSAEFLLVAEPE